MEQPVQETSSPDELRQQIVSSFTRFEKEFRIHYPLLWISTLLAPVVITTAILVVLWMVGGWELPSKLLSHAFATFFVFGRFIILLGAEGGDTEKFKILLTPSQLFGMVTYMDFITALFVTFHLGILFRLPYVGEKIAMLVSDGKFVMDAQPWVRKLAFVGLVAFVIFPTSTTGSIGGSIFGRLLGLSRWTTIGGVLLGSLLGNGLMYAFAKTINQYVDPNNIWLKVIGGIIVLALVVLLERRYQKVKRRFLEQQSGAGEVEAEAP